MATTPRQLPGLYWDHERQRYFPLQSAPTLQQKQPTIAQSVSGPDAIAIRRCRTSHQALSDLRSVLRTAHKDALIHQMQSSQFLLTDRITRSTVIRSDGLVSAFQSVCHSGRMWRFAGDTLGWFYSSALDMDHQGTGIIDIDGWQQLFHLSSEVSSIGLSGSTCVATSFGPECRILYVPLDSPVEGMHVSRLDSRKVHDVWTADLEGSRLVLGANKQAVVIEDIALSASLRHLPTQSDVLALAQRESLVYTGLRNGSLLRFDTRVQRSSGYPLFGSDYTSLITNIKHLRDHQLLVSFIDGGISTFDIRFPIRTPLMTFTGNINSYTVKLPLVTDPHEKLLFAAGQDNKIRIWSLMAGGPALHSGGAGATDQTLLQRPFEHRVAALQVTEEKQGICLWAASGTELYKYSLGNRSRYKLQVTNMSSLTNMVAS